MTPTNPSAPTLVQHLKFGIIQGIAAWSAYALIEFLASSVLFRLGRPYARFTTWHWNLTGQLALAYLTAGLLAGAVVAVAAFLLRHTRWLAGGPTALVMEHAATLTLVLAFMLHMATTPAPPDGWWKLLVIPLGFTAILLLAIHSAAWSSRLGLLTNPWMVAGLFLGLAQVSVLEDMGVAEQFHVPLQFWYYALIGLQAAVAVLAVWLGRRWRLAVDPARVFAPNWAAAGLAVALASAGFLLGAEPSPAAPNAAIAGSSPHPNVILIVMDTVRADHLSLYGYPRDTTPNLRKLAADSTVYSEALSAADITLTSHASIFTGLYPSWHGAYCQPPEAAFGRRIGPVPTIAETLSRNGYHSLGVAANLYLRNDFGLQRGFADFRIPRPVPILAAESWYMLRNGMRQAMNLFADTAQFDRLYSRADAVNRQFFDLLAQPSLAQAPFFAFFNYMDAHFPYIPPAPFDRLFPGKRSSLSEGALESIQDRVSTKGDPLPPLYPTYAISQYDGGIAYIDSHIGQLADWLKRQNLYDNTMLIVTADHGEAFGEKRLFLHGNSLYANLTHVPLLVKFPHSAHTGRVDTPISLIDIFPTVMNAVGVDPPPGLQGENLLDPKALAPRNIYSESFPCPVLHQASCPGGCAMRSVVSWPDKYIWASNGRLETYQLERDPNENHNLFGALNKTAQVLATSLRAWNSTRPKQEIQHRYLTPEEKQRFKSLGYIQ